ncbi:MAG TPA: class I SAM-dependent methyltransferase [Thermomicrobiales bacterium]|jgi:SAM-dependent methyltransferase|nr:class I SAM-dependent methyltransferase [Thermomicrobiales bacterium]
MSERAVRGTAGYGGNGVTAFHAASEALTFEEVHADLLDLIPVRPGRALDAGAGTGRDAAALVAREWNVVAAEPVAAFREQGQRAHPSTRITWHDDALPHLDTVRSLGFRYDLVVACAVWMHLNAGERSIGWRVLGDLTTPGGLVIMSLRHGPVPAGRWMDDVSGDETVTAASATGFELLRRRDNRPSLLPGKTDVTWTRLAFRQTGSLATPMC